MRLFGPLNVGAGDVKYSSKAHLGSLTRDGASFSFLSLKFAGFVRLPGLGMPNVDLIVLLEDCAVVFVTDAVPKVFNAVLMVLPHGNFTGKKKTFYFY